jgi:hypothetical protein
MGNIWFKFYGSEYLGDAKILCLSAIERSCWVTLLCHACSTNDGVIRYLSEENLLVQSGVSPKDVETHKGIILKLQDMQMITVDNGVITIKNWQKRQERSLTAYERVKRYRQKKRNDNANDNDREEEKRRDKKRIDKSIGEISTPKTDSLKFFSMVEQNGEEYEKFIQTINTKTGADPGFLKMEIKKFCNFWLERNRSGTKRKWELERTFEVDRRLSTWFRNAQKWSSERKTKGKSIV